MGFVPVTSVRTATLISNLQSTGGGFPRRLLGLCGASLLFRMPETDLSALLGHTKHAYTAWGTSIQTSRPPSPSPAPPLPPDLHPCRWALWRSPASARPGMCTASARPRRGLSGRPPDRNALPADQRLADAPTASRRPLRPRLHCSPTHCLSLTLSSRQLPRSGLCLGRTGRMCPQGSSCPTRSQVLRRTPPVLWAARRFNVWTFDRGGHPSGHPSVLCAGPPFFHATWHTHGPGCTAPGKRSAAT